MRPYRLIALGLATLMLAAACVEPEEVIIPTAPAAPTGAEGPDGAPIGSLCDLLAAEDVNEITGKAATRPPTDEATDSLATCDYGEGVSMRVEVAPTVAEAEAAYDREIKTEPFTTTVKEQAIGGVDQSQYGHGADSSGLAVRRLRLVLTFVVPGTGAETGPLLIQLAARVLDRANALGT